jgi:hypothetical protein
MSYLAEQDFAVDVATFRALFFGGNVMFEDDYHVLNGDSGTTFMFSVKDQKTQVF